MELKDLTKKVLTEVAEDLSKIFEDSIKVNTKSTVATITKDLIDAGNELQKEDEISDKSKEVLALLGVKLPWVIEEETPSDIDMPPNLIDKSKGKSAAASNKPAVKKAGGKNEPGVIASILEFISTSKKGITIPEIHKDLIARFADRDADAMLKTIKAQVGGKKSPCRLEKEKKVTFEIQDGKYSIK